MIAAFKEKLDQEEDEDGDVEEVAELSVGKYEHNLPKSEMEQEAEFFSHPTGCSR